MSRWDRNLVDPERRLQTSTERLRVVGVQLTYLSTTSLFSYFLIVSSKDNGRLTSGLRSLSIP